MHSNGSHPPSIFRPEALQHYQRSRERQVMPRLIRPRTFVCLWLLLCLLLAGTILVWMTQIPIYVAGPAIVVNRGMPVPTDSDDVSVAVFLPARYHSEIQEGQALHLQTSESSERQIYTIQWAARTVLSPIDAQTRFGLPLDTAPFLTQPVTVVGTTLPTANALRATAYGGSIFRADVQVGTRRVLSLLSLSEGK